jgi:hypothetical protein
LPFQVAEAGLQHRNIVLTALAPSEFVSLVAHLCNRWVWKLFVAL